MTRALLALILAACVATIVTAAGQVAFRTSVEAVRLDVSVTRGGRPVAGLNADDFEVTDNGAIQHVENVLVDSQSVSVFLVLDTSGSVNSYGLRDLIGAAQALVNAVRIGDRAALITFSTEVAVRVPLTADASSLRSALASVKAQGSTALRDAVFSALHLGPEDGTRSLVLVFSDGDDTASWLSTSDVLEATRRAAVVIHAIQLLPEASVSGPGLGSSVPPPSVFLRSLVNAAGGNLWLSTSPNQLRPLFTQALDEMRARYVLTYYPPNVAKDGWHELKVRLKRGRADIKARPGYFVIPRIQEPGVTR